MSPLRFPSNWATLPPFSKLCYLVNTKQARDFAEAGRMLAARRGKTPPAPDPVKEMEKRKLF